MAQDYDKMGLADLYLVAKDMGITGAKGMRKAALLKAVKAEAKKQGDKAPPEPEKAEQPKPAAAPDPAPAPPEELVKHVNETPAGGKQVVPEPPPEPKKVKSDVVSYLVTKGGRFVKDSTITRLPEGSVLTHLTHDLNAVRGQGIEFEKIEGEVTAGKGQLGETTTLIDGKLVKAGKVA